MRLFYGVSFLLLSVFANSQKLIKGIVVSADQNTPLANASVFLNSTAVGTVTNMQGGFSLTIPAGKYELVVSMIGYETFVQTVSTSDASDFITVKLKIKIEELEAVVVEPYEKDGWQKWGRFFLESFIGTSAYAANCKIKNTHVVKFRLSKDRRELSAFVSEPLVIENNALGYTLRYQLENFHYDFDSRYLLYVGYPYFQPMKGGRGRQRRWQQNRNNVYTGSIMHFMRSIYRNKIKEEGFEVSALQKIPNTEKQRVKALYSTNTRTERMPDGKMVVTTINADTAEYYRRVMRQPDYTNLVKKDLLPADSIAYSIDSVTASMDFENYLLIVYNKPAPAEYRRQFPLANVQMMSELNLVNKTPIEILSNGYYYNPLDLMSTGYWAWSEKIAALLPFDYTLSKD